MQQETKPCGTCNGSGHSHCPECNGTGRSDKHVITHPNCPKNCGGKMLPTDNQPGSPLKCGICGHST